MSAFGQTAFRHRHRRRVTYERNAWGNKTGDAVQPAKSRRAK